MKADKLFVAVATPDRKVNFRTVTLMDSDANTVLLLLGIEDGEVNIQPGLGYCKGDPVQAVDAKPNNTDSSQVFEKENVKTEKSCAMDRAYN